MTSTTHSFVDNSLNSSIVAFYVGRLMDKGFATFEDAAFSLLFIAQRGVYLLSDYIHILNMFQWHSDLTF